MNWFRCWVVLFLLMSRMAISQENDSIQVNAAKLVGVASTGGLLYSGVMLGLSTVWYKDLNQVGFHFTNDNASWQQIDKFGHAYSSYLFSKVGMEALKRTGLGSKKAALWGGVYGFSFLTTIEVIDGHYSVWGFSTVDMVANAVGPMLLIGQELLLTRQFISFKYSYHPTEFVKLRPNVFGKNIFNQLVADYNGQTYWLSFNLGSVIPKNKYFPKWLSLSAGYGASGMLSGYSNPSFDNFGNPYPAFERTRSYYLSLDIDFDKIKTNKKVLKMVLSFLNLVKVPFPAFEINGNGKASMHPFYF